MAASIQDHESKQELLALEKQYWEAIRSRRDGSWVCAAHTETLAGDPYGRK